MRRYAILMVLLFLALGIATGKSRLFPEDRSPSGGTPDPRVLTHLVELFDRTAVAPDDVLDRAIDLVPASPGAAAGERGAWLTTVGRALGRAGRGEEAERILREALRVVGGERGAHDPATAEAWLEIAEAQARGADLESARRTALEALTALQGGRDTDAAALARCRLRLAELAAGLDDLDDAEDHARQALAALSLPDAAPVETAHAARVLGEVLFLRGQHGEAEQHLARALELRLAALGPHAPEVAEALFWHGRLDHALGRLDAAEEAFGRAREIYEARHAPELWAALPNLARVSHSAGDFPAARRLYDQALELRAGRQHDVALAGVLHGLGSVARRRGDLDRASALLAEALTIRQATLAPSHPEIAANLHQLGLVKSDLGDVAAAETLMEQALAARERVLGPRHRSVEASLKALADLFTTHARFAEAADLYERAWKIHEARSACPADS